MSLSYPEDISYSIDLVLASVAVLAQSRKHDASTFTSENTDFFDSVYSTLARAGLPVEIMIRKMLASETIAFATIWVTTAQLGELESAFRAAGLESSLPAKAS